MLKRDEYIKKIVPFIDKDVIKVLTGIRRSGKSVMLKLLMEELKNRGINENQFIYINFENLKYRNLKNYEKLYDFILNKVDDKYKSYYIFLDEIQEVEEWERCVNSLRVDEELRFDIYITGSNAKLLSGELSTYLAGRYIEFVVYPFSFKEFFEIMKEKNKEIDLKEAFQDYVKFGGMPFLHNLDYNFEASMQYLQDLYASIILKDITQRNNIRDTDLLERIINYVIMNIGNTFSATSISKFFKSENRKVATETILNYIKACEEAFLVYRVARNDLLGKKILNVNEKYYIADHGIREAIMENNQKNINQVLENIVYFEMLRRGYNVKIGKVDNLEVDFVCKKNDETIYIQVSYLLASEDTKESIWEQYLINKKSPDNIRIRLKPIESDSVSYKQLIDNNDDSSNSNVCRNYKIFKELLENSHYSAEQIYSALYKIELVTIKLEKDKKSENPQLIFESLNSTGLSLTQADLIRNYLLMNSEYEKQTVLYKNFWLKIEIELTNKKISDFIRDFLTMKTGKIANKNKVYDDLIKLYDEKEEAIGEEIFRRIERYIMLEVLDSKWRQHLKDLTELREGIRLRSYGQRNPIHDYKIVAYDIYNEMIDAIKRETSSFILKLRVRSEEDTNNLTHEEVSNVKYEHNENEMIGDDVPNDAANEPRRPLSRRERRERERRNV